MFLDVAADRRRCLVGHGPDGGHVHVEESAVGAALQQKVQVSCEKLQDQEPISTTFEFTATYNASVVIG
jgi:hypothetical protein